MSFALEFRKKLQQQEREAAHARKINEGFVAAPAGELTDTPQNRRRVLLALVIAGGVLAVFNSGALVRYTQDLAGNPIGERLIVLSERWHEMMQRKQATRVVEEIRGSLALVREANWHDLTQHLRIKPSHAQPENRDGLKVVPAKGDAPPEVEPNDEPGRGTPTGPVLRASVEGP